MAKTKKGGIESLVVPTRGGLNKKNYASKGMGVKTAVKEGTTIPIQFSTKPTNKKKFREFDLHRWQEGKKKYPRVPCIGEDICPLCDDDDPDISKVAYQFVTPIYNLKTKKYELLSGGKNMANAIGLRYERMVKTDTAGKWLRLAFDLTAVPAQFTTYDLVKSDTHKPITLDESKLIDIDKWLLDEVKGYYGDNMPSSSLDDDDDDEDEEEDDDEDEDEEDDEDEAPRRNSKTGSVKSKKKKSRK